MLIGRPSHHKNRHSSEMDGPIPDRTLDKQYQKTRIAQTSHRTENNAKRQNDNCAYLDMI